MTFVRFGLGMVSQSSFTFAKKATIKIGYLRVGLRRCSFSDYTSGDPLLEQLLELEALALL